jgi:hypothetical protein
VNNFLLQNGIQSTYQGIKIYIPDSLYPKLDTIEIKSKNPEEKLQFVKAKPNTIGKGK